MSGLNELTLDISLIWAVGIFALAGYAIGRTITQETIFEGLVTKFKNKAYYPTDDLDIFQAPDGAIVRQVPGTSSFDVVSQDGYRTDLPRPLALALGKTADLLTCVFCASAQAAFQLALWTVVFTVLPLSLSVMMAAVGVTFLINDWLNGHNQEE